MEQQERISAAYTVDGYYTSVGPIGPCSPGHKTAEDAFAAAHAECIHHLAAQLANVESLTFAAFLEGRRGR